MNVRWTERYKENSCDLAILYTRELRKGFYYYFVRTFGTVCPTQDWIVFNPVLYVDDAFIFGNMNLFWWNRGDCSVEDRRGDCFCWIGRRTIKSQMICWCGPHTRPDCVRVSVTIDLDPGCLQWVARAVTNVNIKCLIGSQEAHGPLKTPHRELDTFGINMMQLNGPFRVIETDISCINHGRLPAGNLQHGFS